MKKKNVPACGIFAAVTLAALLLTGCPQDTADSGGGKADYTAASIADMREWLSGQPDNTAAAAYTVKLNVSDIGGDSWAYDSTTDNSAGMAIRLSEKYVSLDLSGSTITTIPDEAFGSMLGRNRNPYLTGITIPNSVTAIGNRAFFDCTSLARITIPASVTSIGREAFAYCTSLASVTIPASVTTIEAETFLLCTSLASVTIPNSVTSIESQAFELCTSLASVTIPASVTSIESWAFARCTSLAAINAAAANTAYTSQDGVLYNKNKTLLHTYPAGKTGSTFTIPNSVASIGDGAFVFCTSLTSVTIGNSVTSIETWAFSDCTSLASVTIGNSVDSIGHSAFIRCTGLASVTIPNSVTSIGIGAFLECTSLASVTFQGTIASDRFKSSAFHGDLHDKYLAGGIGTYTTNTTNTPIPDVIWEWELVWTKI